MAQNNLGNALLTLGERESGTERLERAVVAFQAALEERTRERVPLEWAGTQLNLGNALQTMTNASDVYLKEAGQTQHEGYFKRRIEAALSRMPSK